MRLSSLLPLLGAATLALGQSKRPSKIPKPTTFDGVEVPPILELTHKTHETVGNATTLVMVKYHSPFCLHCLDFAPTYQTAYEFYYTSQPEGTDKNFTEAYDIQFAHVNCIAYFDLCSDYGVKTFPTTHMYKDGKLFEKLRGAKNITLLSGVIERGLEAVKPGSRPTNIMLPKPKDTTSPVVEVAQNLAAETTGRDVPVAVEQEKTEEIVPPPAAVEEEPAVVVAQEVAVEEKPAESVPQEVVADEKPAESVPQQAAAEEKPAESVPEVVATEEKSEEIAPEPVAAQLVEETTATEHVPVFPTPTIVLPMGPKSTATPNPRGESVDLTAESFQNHVTMTQDPWFIKFHAPWCTHCKSLAPTWEQLAKNMKGRLNIGEVNCDNESRLCKDVRLSGYPTIILFKGAERVEYEGLRGLGDLLHFSESAIELTSGIPLVDAEAFEALEKVEPVIFTYFYDHAAASEDFLALERIPINLIGRAKLVRTHDPELYKRFKITTWPRLMVAREGRPTYYTPIIPTAMRDIPAILKWMKSVWLPIVPELTAANAREIMDGKVVVLGILNRDNEDAFNSAQREMKSAANEWMDKQIQLFQLERQELRDAKQLRIEEATDRGDSRAQRQAKAIRINMDMSDRKQVTFAWVDGVLWQRWIRTTYGMDVKDGDRVIINDEDNRRYWDNTITGNNIVPSRTSIMETISKVTAQPPKIKPKLTISGIEKIFFDFKMTTLEHPWLVLGCFSGIAIAALSWFRGRLRRTRQNFKLEDAVGMKDGLLGGGPSGKVD